MTEQKPSSESATEKQPAITIDSASTENEKVNEEHITETLKAILENAGQISELTSEEENLVTDFFNSLSKILSPFGRTLEIPPNILPKSYRDHASMAYLYTSGQLAIVYTDGKAEILDLIEKRNRTVLTSIMGETISKLKDVIGLYKTVTESRVKFLLSITKELQKAAEVFAEEPKMNLLP